jgi:hypothetical protein
MKDQMTRSERIDEIKGRRYERIEKHIVPYDAGRCASYDQFGESSDSYEQCGFPPGHGLGGLFCKQHAKNNPEVE